MEMRSFVTIQVLVLRPKYNRLDFSLRQASFVVKQFVSFGGVEHVETLALVFPCSPSLYRVRWCRCSIRSAPNSFHRRKDRGHAEAPWLFQPLLGHQAGQAVARDRQVERGISLSERPFRGHRFE